MRQRNFIRSTGSLLVGYVAAALWFRHRSQPAGVNPDPASYRMPSDRIRFFQDSSWYEGDQPRHIRQITDEVVRIIRSARRFVLMDVFLFNLHHTREKGPFIPTTRQIADAFTASDRPAYFITDPLNISYGTQYNKPLKWLENAGVKVCVVDTRRLRDSNLVYAPLWRLLLRWFGTGKDGELRNPLQADRTTTIRAGLEAVTARADHRKLLIADDGDDGWITLVTSSNFEDASSFFGNTALSIRDRRVASHFLEAEKAVARLANQRIDFDLPQAREAEAAEQGDALVTPLMGDAIAESLIADLEHARPGDRLWVCSQFLSHRAVIEQVLAASRRGVDTTLVLDQNKYNFGQRKRGYPNQYVAQELVARGRLRLRWANMDKEENHNKFVLIERQDQRCVLTLGSANLTRRSLSNTVLEADVRVEAPADASFMKDAIAFARSMAEAPRSQPAEAQLHRSRLKYWFYRFQEATGTGTY